MFDRENLGKLRVANCVDFMVSMPCESVDLVVTSPPYDNLRNYKGYSFDFERIAKDAVGMIKEDSGDAFLVWLIGSDSCWIIPENEAVNYIKNHDALN
jgi:site-specific DNA-methyltransferase (adenine-specific)